MASRRWSLFVLALLLVWQLNAAVAVAVPRVGAQTGGVATGHCAQHMHAGLNDATPAPDRPGPQAPDCCREGSAACQCAHLPALATLIVGFGDTPPSQPQAAARPAARADARTADFFRPPI